MPYTWAFAVFRAARLSRKVQSSLVHTELNAAGKKASTTGWPRWALSVTDSRSWLTSVKSGAFEPTSTDMTPPGVLGYDFWLAPPKRRLPSNRRKTLDRGPEPHEAVRSIHRRRRHQLPRRAR